MTTAEIVSASIAAFGVLTALVAVIKTGKKDAKCDIAADESLRADVKYLVRGMDDIRADLKGHGKQLQSHERRITRLETINGVPIQDEE